MKEPISLLRMFTYLLVQLMIDEIDIKLGRHFGFHIHRWESRYHFIIIMLSEVLESGVADVHYGNLH
jgi:hypothetical protein